MQEVAFTLANGLAYVEAALARGLAIDEFAPRLSFFFNAHNDFLEEVAKFRAARRLWAELMRERFAPQDERSLWLRFHTQTAGSTLTAQQPDNNVVRVAIQALAAVLRRHAVAAHQRARRGARPADRGRRRGSRCARSRSSPTRAASPTSPIRWAAAWAIEALTDEIVARARALHRAHRRDGRRARGDRARLPAGRDRRRRLRLPARGRGRASSKVVGVNCFEVEDEAAARGAGDRPARRGASRSSASRACAPRATPARVAAPARAAPRRRRREERNLMPRDPRLRARRGHARRDRRHAARASTASTARRRSPERRRGQDSGPSLTEPVSGA